MAATMSSTDSASVFSILRTHGIGLKHDLRPLLELESGANDPMAYVLTSTMIGVCLSGSAEVSGLTIECRQKLAKYNPRTIAQASRISGVSPADISVLIIWLEQKNRG